MSLTVTPLIAPDQPWQRVEGSGYVAHAKIHDAPSIYGFLGGRMSTITIWRADEEPTMPNALFHYSRGFDRSDLDGRGLWFLCQLVDHVDGWAWLKFADAFLRYAIRDVVRMAKPDPKDEQ